MKKLLLTVLGIFMVVSFAASASAKTFKMGLDADPVSLDPQVQLSGGMLQLSHWVFDPLVRWTQDMEFEPRLATSWERLDELTMR
ncbi:MAG TPA: ABC transporter substrate-binding protein, partial [Desulfotignum sp.]|nr:ABC transporter substrate-binding protein [Desulfotignum sp.]